MKKNVLAILLLFISVAMSGQVTIGCDIEPKEGAILDLKEADDYRIKDRLINSSKGLGLPRVSLKGLDMLEPCAHSTTKNKACHKGLIVYHVGSNYIPEGEYVWDGAKWAKKIVVSNVSPKDEQFLRFNEETQSVEWTTVEIPSINKGDLYQYSSTVAVDRKGVDLYKRPYEDANPYKEFEAWNADWKVLEGLSLVVRVPDRTDGGAENVSNRLAIDFQTGVQTSSTKGWISYAIGVFVKLENESTYKLRLVRTATLWNSFGSGYPFETYTMLGAMDNLPPGNHNLIVAARRRNQQNNTSVLAVGKKYSSADNTSIFQLQSMLRATLYLKED